MAKAKKGMNVGHKSGRTGKITGSASGGVFSWVKFSGAKRSVLVPTSSLHKKGGLCLLWMAGFLGFTGGLIGGVIDAYS